MRRAHALLFVTIVSLTPPAFAVAQSGADPGSTSTLGGFLPKLDSLRTEGGTVKLAQAHADVFAGVRYAITPQLFADGGFSYTYFSQHETSGEDNNKVLFLGYAFGFGLTYAF